MKLSIALATVLHRTVLSQTVLDANPTGCINLADYEDGTDFFPDKFFPDETTDFLHVTYHNTYKIVHNAYTDKYYLMYQCGTEPPANEVASDKYHVIVSVPFNGTIGITETPQIPPLEVLGKRSAIGAYIGDPKFISSPCLISLMDDGIVETIFYPEDPYDTELTRQGWENYASRNPDSIMIAGPFGDATAEMTVTDPQTSEKTAVATFDWLGMYAVLFNHEAHANEIISRKKTQYECTAENAASLTSDIQDDQRPNVLWAQYFDENSAPPSGGWSIAECPTWDAAYYCEYAHHCGAKIMGRPESMGFNVSYGGPEVYWYLSDEEFAEFGKDAEHWIYAGPTFDDDYNLKKDLLDQFKSVQNKQVFDTQGQGPYAWYEQRLAEYDVVALDFCSIVGTASPFYIHERRWFRNIYTDAIGTQGTCDGDEMNLAYEPEDAKCAPFNIDGSGSSTGEEPAPSPTEVTNLASTSFMSTVVVAVGVVSTLMA